MIAFYSPLVFSSRICLYRNKMGQGAKTKYFMIGRPKAIPGTKNVDILALDGKYSNSA